MKDPSLSDFAVNLEMWWQDSDRLDRVRRAADFGFTWVELWFWHHWNVESLASLIDDNGLRVAQFGGWDFEPSMSSRENHEAFENGIVEALEVASLLGTHLINLNGPHHDPSRKLEDQLLAVVEALQRVAPLAAEKNVTLMVEPMNLRVDHPGYLLPTSKDVTAICEAVGSEYVKVNWDLYHLSISEGDLSGHFREGQPHVGYVQIADHPGRHEPGTGEINYPFLLNFVRSEGYAGPIGLEFSPAHSPQRAIERLKAASRASVGQTTSSS